MLRSNTTTLGWANWKYNLFKICGQYVHGKNPLKNLCEEKLWGFRVSENIVSLGEVVNSTHKHKIIESEFMAWPISLPLFPVMKPVGWKGMYTQLWTKGARCSPIRAYQWPEWGWFPCRNNQTTHSTADLHVPQDLANPMDERDPPIYIASPVDSKRIYGSGTRAPESAIECWELSVIDMGKTVHRMRSPHCINPRKIPGLIFQLS